MAPRESRIIAVDGKPVSHVRIVYSYLSIYGARVKAASFGGVCTDPDYRGRGIASRLLEHCIGEVAEAGAKLLIISGDRGLYLRAGAVLAGPVWSASVRLEYGTGARTPVTARPAAPGDASTLARLYQAEPVRFMRPARFFHSLLGGGHRQPWLLEQAGRPVAYMSLSRIWDLPRAAPVRALGEYAGSRAALVDGLAAVLPGAELEEIRLSFPAYDRELAYLLRARGAELSPATVPSHSFRLLDAAGLMRVLRPYCASRCSAGVLRALRVEPNGERTRLTLGGETVDLDISQVGALALGGAEAPVIGGELGAVCARVFPIPLPLPGFNYV